MHIPDLQIPAPVSRLLARLPATPPAWLLVRLLNRAMRMGIMPDDMSLLSGRHFAVCVRDAGITLRFEADDQGFRTSAADTPPDLTLSAGTADFLRMMLREEDPDTLFFSRRLDIEGDTELGLVVKNLLDSIDWSHTPLARFMAA